MTSNNNTILFKNNIDSGVVTNKVDIDDGDNNTIINETRTKARKITLDLRKTTPIRGKNNKIVNRFHSPRGSKIKVIINKNPKAKISLKVRKV